MRSHDGRDLATVTWDGMTTRVNWKAQSSGRIRHWRMLDVDGAEVASGMVDADQLEGWNMHCNLHWLMSV